MNTKNVIDAIMQCLAGGHFSQAEKISVNLIVNNPAEPLGWKARGVTKHLCGEPIEALLCFTYAIALAPLDPESHYNHGFSLQSLDRHHEAVSALLSAVAIQPDHAQARCNLAVSFEAIGQSEVAIHQIRTALIIQPGYADALNNLGFLYQARAHYQAASWGYRHAVCVVPHSPKLMSNLAICLQMMGELGEAESCCHAALAQDPEFAEAHNNLSVVLKTRKRFSRAKSHARTALILQPAYADSLNNLAVLHHEGGDYLIARNLCQRALNVKTAYAEAWNNLANATVNLGFDFEAEDAYKQALVYKPSYAEAYNNLSILLFNKNKKTIALSLVRRAIVFEPEYVAAWCNLGAMLKESEYFLSSEFIFLRAIRLDPYYPDAYNNLGIALHNKKRFDKARMAYDRAIEIDSNHCLAKINKALMSLLLGQYKDGFKNYEERFSGPDSNIRLREPISRAWSGNLKIQGKTILLYAEQGLGDTIQFSRYARYLVAKGAKVILEVQKPLESLFLDQWENVDVVAQGSNVPKYDWHCPLMSIPNLMGFDPTLIPFCSGYLKVPLQRLNYWISALGAKVRPRIGLCCSGHPSHANDSNRSIPWENFKTLMTCDADYFLLQKEIRSRDAIALDGSIGITIPSIQDFNDTACLIMQMDLVVTVDTSLAHLSGALGKPTWLLLPWVPDWRWQLQGAESPWYKSFKLYRQNEPYSWAGVLNEVGASLCHEFNQSDP